MPIFKCVAALFAAVGSLSAFGISVRDAKAACKENGGFGPAMKKDSKSLWENLTEIFRGGWK